MLGLGTLPRLRASGMNRTEQMGVVDVNSALVQLMAIPSVVYEQLRGFWFVSPEPELYQQIVNTLARCLPWGSHVLYTWVSEENRFNEKGRSEASPIDASALI